MYKKAWDRVVSSDAVLYKDAADGLKRALNKQSYAFLVEKSYYDTLKSKNESFSHRSCDFARAKESFLNILYAFPMRKNSPYLQLFSKQ